MAGLTYEPFSAANGSRLTIGKMKLKVFNIQVM